MGRTKPKAPDLGNVAGIIDHAKFLEMLTREYPEVPQAFSEYGKGLLHCEMGTFARLAEKAMDEGFWKAEQYFRAK